MDVVLSCKNVSKKYSDSLALDGVSFNVQAGEVFVLLGLPGSGKSTLLNIISGFVSHSSGDLFVLDLHVDPRVEQTEPSLKNSDNKSHRNHNHPSPGATHQVSRAKGGSIANTRSSRDAILRKIGMVPETHSLDTELTVAENLQLSAWHYDLRKLEFERRLVDVIEEFKLQRILLLEVASLTEEQLRRVQLAKSLLHNPEIWILDDPLKNLNFAARKSLLNAVKRERRTEAQENSRTETRTEMRTEARTEMRKETRTETRTETRSDMRAEARAEARSEGRSDSRALLRSKRTLLVATERVDELVQEADRIAIVHQGRLLAVGSPRELISEHIGLEVLEFAVKSEELNYYLEKYRGQGIEARAIGEQRVILFLKTKDSARQLIPTLLSDEITLRNSTLEDVFLYLTGLKLCEVGKT